MILENKIIVIISSIAAILIAINIIFKFIDQFQLDYILFMSLIVFIGTAFFYGNKNKGNAE